MEEIYKYMKIYQVFVIDIWNDIYSIGFFKDLDDSVDGINVYIENEKYKISKGQIKEYASTFSSVFDTSVGDLYVSSHELTPEEEDEVWNDEDDVTLQIRGFIFDSDELGERIDSLKEKKEMNIKVVLDEKAYMPVKAHSSDAGFDLKSRETVVIPAHGDVKFDTGVHMEIPVGYVGFLKSKSGLNVKYGLTGTGVIDAGYTGPIVVKLYNNSDNDYTVSAGDKIIQIVILPIPEVNLETATEIQNSERGDNGFGSSGK